jgi:hypothetical protein
MEPNDGTPKSFIADDAPATPVIPKSFIADPVAPQKPSDLLPRPEDVDAQTTAAARAIAQRVTQPQAPPAGPTIGPRTPSFMERLVAPFRDSQIGHAFGVDTRTDAARQAQPDQLVNFGAALDQNSHGVLRGIADFASGMTTPENLLLMAGTGGLGAIDRQLGASGLSKLVSGGFSAQMLWDAVRQSPEFARQVKSGDSAGARETLTKIVLGGLMSAAALKHGMAAETPAPAATPTMVQDAQSPFVDPGAPYPAAPPTNRDARRATAQPPESGTPEGVARGVDARERIAQQLAGKPFGQLSAGEQNAIDELIAENNKGQAGREKTPASFIPDKEQPNEKETNARESGAETKKQSGEQPDDGRPTASPEPSIERPATEQGPLLAEQPQSEPAAPAPGAREPAVKPAYGRHASVAVPGEATNYPMRYAVREAADVQPSHNPHSFEPNPDYEHRNDRDYSEAGNAARVVQYAQEFRPDFMLTDAPTAEQGAPLIDQRGNALGGNNRTMTLKRVYRQSADSAAAYRSALRDRAPQFGIDPREVDRFREPVLVREATYPMDRQQAQIAITDFNKSSAAAASPAEQAVRDGRRMTPSTVAELGARIQDAGETGTLAQALQGEDGAAALNHLMRDGVLTQQEANGYVDERGHLTAEAKDRIGKALVGRLFESPAEYNQTPPELRAKLERVAPQVLRVEGREGWQLTPAVRDALSAIGDARAHGIRNLDDLARQESLGGETRSYSPDAIAIAKALNNGPLTAAQAFRRYANDEALSRDGAQGSFFTPPTRTEAFDDAFRPRASQRGAISPQLLTLGAEQFWTDDVAPALHDAAATVVEAADDVLKILAPTARSRPAQRAGLIMRNKLAELARRSDRAEASLKEAKRAFDRMTPAENYEFIRRVEAGQKQQAPELDAIAGLLRKMLDERRADVQALGKGKLQSFYQDYFPHIWKKPKSAANAFASLMGRRPLEGPKSFLKKRTHITFEDGLNAGLKPATDNTVEMALLKLREMDRYIVAHQTLADWKANGLARFIDARNGKAPAGWTKITDPIGAVYGPSQIGVKEYLNKGIVDGLRRTLAGLKLDHRRKMRVSGAPGALGVAFKGTNRLQTKFASDEQTLAHEIGHHLEWQYPFVDRMMKHPDAKTRKILNQELRTLVDQRFASNPNVSQYYKSYVRQGDEKAAAIVQAYVSARPLFQQVAPRVLAEFENHIGGIPSLSGLRNTRASLEHEALEGQVDAGGLVIRGNYYAPEGAARILNNYLEPGLRVHGAYRALLGANNVLNQFQLGMSGFHAGFTSAETVVSKGALAIEQAMRGKFAAAAKSVAQMPIAPVKTFLEGSKVLREWYKPGSEGAPIAAIVDALEKGGGRARMDRTYQTDIGENMMRALRRGNLLGGLVRAPFAGVEAMSNLIMKELVPRQKLGVFADLARHEMERLGPGATVEQTRDAMAKAWDSVENRLGEMTYDNLFWDRTAKDLAMLSVRSVGWNLGTLREVGGAGTDAARIAGRLARGRSLEGINTHRLAYVASLTVTGAAMGAIYQYLATGKGPEEPKDYYFPKTGQLDEAGRPQRMSLPLYVKDIYHYLTSPGKTLAGKASPLVSLMAEMIRNEDFYGAKIRNEDDPLVKQLHDEAMHVARTAVPLSVRNLEREAGLDAPVLQRAEQFAGITPAPADLERTPAELLAHELAGAHVPAGSRTSEQVERTRLKSELARSLRLKRGIPAEVTAARKAGDLTAKDIREAAAESKQAPLARAFSHLGVEDAIKVYRAGNIPERKALRAPLVKKARSAIANLPPEEAHRVIEKLKAALASK